MSQWSGVHFTKDRRFNLNIFFYSTYVFRMHKRVQDEKKESVLVIYYERLFLGQSFLIWILTYHRELSYEFQIPGAALCVNMIFSKERNIQPGPDRVRYSCEIAIWSGLRGSRKTYNLSHTGISTFKRMEKSVTNNPYETEKQKKIEFKGYETSEGVGKLTGNSAYVAIPKSWIGKRVAVVLLESADEE